MTAPLTNSLSGADPNARDEDGRTPAHHAASHGQGEVLAVLLSFGADISAIDRELDTPLHRATRERHTLAMSLLESAGADAEAKNRWGELAGTLAPDYKMNPAVSNERGNHGRGVKLLITDGVCIVLAFISSDCGASRPD